MEETKPLKIFQLDVSTLETIEDIKKVLNGLEIRIQADDPLYEELKDYFRTEVVPRGYKKVLEVLGHREVGKMSYKELEEKAFEILLGMEVEKHEDFN